MIEFDRESPPPPEPDARSMLPTPDARRERERRIWEERVLTSCVGEEWALSLGGTTGRLAEIGRAHV